MLIYIAGPLTAQHASKEAANVQHAIDAGIKLLMLGHAPVIPHLTWYFDARVRELGFEVLREAYIWWGKRLLAVCDAILYLGSSPGADEELQFAQQHGLQVFRSYKEVPPATKPEASHPPSVCMPRRPKAGQ